MPETLVLTSVLIEFITDNTGALVQRLSYDPWGRRRNPDNWTSYTVDQPMFSKGFTGHVKQPFGLHI